MRSQINRKNVKERGKRDKRKNHKLKPDRCSKKKDAPKLGVFKSSLRRRHTNPETAIPEARQGWRHMQNSQIA